MINIFVNFHSYAPRLSCCHFGVSPKIMLLILILILRATMLLCYNATLSKLMSWSHTIIAVFLRKMTSKKDDNTSILFGVWKMKGKHNNLICSILLEVLVTDCTSLLGTIWFTTWSIFIMPQPKWLFIKKFQYFYNTMLSPYCQNTFISFQDIEQNTELLMVPILFYQTSECTVCIW